LDTGITIELLTVAIAAFIASTIAAVTGTGGGIILLPVLVATLGVRDAVPAYTLAQLIGNLSRVGFNRREIRVRVVGWFALGAVPMAVAGAILFTRTGDQTLMRILGVFLLGSVVWRRLRGNRPDGFPVQRFSWKKASERGPGEGSFRGGKSAGKGATAIDRRVVSGDGSRCRGQKGC